MKTMRLVVLVRYFLIINLGFVSADGFYVIATPNFNVITFTHMKLKGES